MKNSVCDALDLCVEKLMTASEVSKDQDSRESKIYVLGMMKLVEGILSQERGELEAIVRGSQS